MNSVDHVKPSLQRWLAFTLALVTSVSMGCLALKIF